MNYGLVDIATLIVGAFFFIPGIIELALWRRFVDRFIQWGYPSYWPIVTYLLKIFGGGMIFYPPTRTMGLLICACISVSALATIIYRKVKSEYKAIPVNIIVLALIAFASMRPF
jgi:hypothetical protein